MDKLLYKKAKSRWRAFKDMDANLTSVKAIDEEKHIILIKFCSFGTIDSDRDMLMKGCISKSIQERGPESSTNRKILPLWQHDRTNPIGKVLTLEERDDGGYATIQLSDFEAVPDARRTWVQLHEGVLNQFSIGYQYVWDKCDYDPDLDCLIVKEIILHEISVVSFGANENTAYLGDVKEIDELEKFVKALKDVSPEQYENMRTRILEMFKAEPATTPLTSRSSVFSKLGQTKN